jgi:5-hydroxyisourate hydrolase
VTETRPTISTHVLDTGSGQPGVGVPVRLWRLGAGGDADAEAGIVGEAVTDADGRVYDLLAGGRLETGAYRLEFGLDSGGFFTGLSVDLRVEDASRSYHIPLLRAPFGLSTYRGS